MNGVLPRRVSLSPLLGLVFGIFTAIQCCIAGAGDAPDGSRQRLHGHVPAAVAKLTPVGRLAPGKRLKLALGLPVRDQAALDDFLRQLSDPASPSFRQYLTPQQFTEKFGPTVQDFEAVAAFAEAHGLRVTQRHANRLIVDVEGSVADIEQALHVTMRVYQHPTVARTFYAPDAEPSLDVPAKVLHIGGLDDFAPPRPHLKMQAAKKRNATPQSGMAPGGAYAGNDFRAAYVPGSTLMGTGQSVALLEFDGYYASDISTYAKQFSLPNIPLMNVAVDGGVSTPGSGNSEVALDIEMVMSMAPGVSTIYVYEAPNLGGIWDDILSKMANDNLAKQLSCSWGGGGPDATAETIFQQMAAQGQSFFTASGDSCAYTSSIPFPSDSPHMTSVGATTLTTTGAGGAYVSESVWNWGGGEGSSGGVSTYYSIPSWQQGISMSANQGSTTMRNIPDVALTGDNVYVAYNNGSNGVFGGTSCAAPLWAAFTALVNQQAVANGRPTVGFVNPAIYSLGRGSSYSSVIHDVTAGNNFWSSSPSKYSAVPGYDLGGGWGSPTGTALINALAGPNDALQVSGTPLAANGPVGGSFTPASTTFTLLNSGSTALNWTSAASQPWLTLSPTGGTLASGASVQVTVSFNSASSSLAIGNYTGTVTITDVTTGVSQPQNVALTVNPLLAVAPASLPPATSGAAYNQTLTAGGGTTPYSSLSITNFNGGTTGVASSAITTNVSAGTVTFSGTPSGAGTVSFTVNVTDGAGASLAQNYSILVNPALSVTPTTLPSGTTGTLYNQAVTVSGGTAPYTSLTVTNFNGGTSGLNAGAVTANPSAGAVTVNGTATGNGIVSFVVNVTDSAGATLSQVCTVGFIKSGPPAPQLDLELPVGTPLISGSSAIGFGSTSVGNSVSQTFTIRNVGNDTLTISGVTFSGTNAADFTVTTAPASSVASLSSTTLVVTFNQTLGTMEQATMSVASNDPTTNPFTVNLAGYVITGGFTTNQAAEVVVGQTSFTTRSTAESQIITPAPSGCAISPTGQLAICDQSYNRVLVWNSIPTSNGAPANVVVGQSTFTSTATGPTASIITRSNGVCFGPGGQLVVSDSGSNRVLIWNTVPSTNGAAANVVIGQTSFTTSTTGTSATQLNNPLGVMVTPSGQLLIADRYNNRILIYNSIPTANGAAADLVIGQSSMTTSASGNSSSQLYYPWGVTLSNSGQLLITDSYNNRILLYNAVPTTNGASANLVIGQTGFGLSTAGTSALTLNVPIGVAVSPTGQLAVGEYGNNRVLIFNSIPTTNGASADVVLGQPNFTTSTALNGGLSATSMETVYQPAFASDGRLLAPGRDMSRLMIFGQSSANGLPYIASANAASTMAAPFSYQISATYNPTSYGASGLPSGLTLNTATGVISGMPIVAGTFPIALSATNVLGTGTATLTLTVNPSLGISPSTLPAGDANSAYNQVITVTGGTMPLTNLSIINFNAGNTGLNASAITASATADTVSISGIPSAAGTASFTVNVTDAAGATLTQNYSILVNPSLALSPTALPNAAVNTPYSQVLTTSGGTAPYTSLTITNFNGGTTGLTASAISSNSSAGAFNISGTPTATGSASFTANVTDTAGATLSETFSITVQTLGAVTLSAPATTTKGAGTVTGTVAIQSSAASDLTVALSSSLTAFATVPATVTINAGQTSTSFPITIINDGLLDGPQSVVLSAAIAGYTTASTNLTVLDSQPAVLSVNVPASLTKGQGTLANAGTVTVSAPPTSSVAISLSSSLTTALTLPATVTLPAGASSANFNITVIDDGQVDGPQHVTVTAHVAGWTDGATTTIVNDSQTTQDWPTFGNGAAHTGYQPVTLGSEAYSAGWTMNYSSAIGLNQAAISGGAVFTTGSNFLSAVSASTGTEIWRHQFASAYSINPPTANAGQIYVQRGDSGSDSQLWCLNAASGAVVWNAPFGAQWESYFAPTVANGSVWIDGGEYGGLYGFNTADGSQRFFNSTLQQFDEWTPAYYNGTVYTWIDGYFRAHDPQTGVVQWALNIGGTYYTYSMNTAPVIAQGRAFVIGSPNSANLYAVDLTSQSSPWSVTGAFEGTPAVANGIVYAISGSNVLAYNTQTGVLAATYSTGDTAISGQPIVTNDSLIVTSSASTYIFNLANSTLQQKISAGGAASLAGGVLFLAGTDGILRTYFPGGQTAITLSIPSSTTKGSPPLTGAVSLSNTSTSDTVINLAASDNNRISLPTSVTIPAGQISATFQFSAINDSLLTGPENVTITATGQTFSLRSASAVITVIDSQTATLSLNAPSSVTEGSTFQVTLGISAPPASNITVSLASSDLGTLLPPTSVVLPAGQSSVTFSVLAVQDGIPNDSKTASLTAHVTGWTDGAASINVLDSGTATTAGWPTFGNGPAHTGYQPVTLGGAAFQQGWAVTYPTSTSGLNQVAVDSGVVCVTPYTYFGDSYLSVLDASSGIEIWRHQFDPSYSINPPTIDLGKIYVQQGGTTTTTSTGRMLWCFNAVGGTTAWTAPFNAQWERYFAPTVSNGGVWVDAGEYGGLYGFNTADGSQRFFNSSLEQYDQWTPVYYNGTVYSWVAGNFRAHDPVTGTILWTVNASSGGYSYAMNTVPAIDQGIAYVIGTGNLSAISLATKAVLWSPGAVCTGSPAVANGILYAISGSGVNAYNGQTGQFLGTYATSDTNISGQPIVTNDTLIVSSSTKTYIFNINSFSLLQTLPSGGVASLANRVLYLAGSGGVLTTYYPSSLPLADVSVAQSLTPTNAPSGTTVTITLTAANNGPGTAYGAIVQDTLPAGLSYVSAVSTSGICSQAGGVVTCALGTMPNGANATITITATSSGAANLTNTALMTSQTFDTNGANNSTSVAINTAVPIVTTLAATNGGYLNTILNGSVDPNGMNTTVSFDYGLTTSYGTNVAASPATVTAGSGATAVSASITGLTPNTLYHFRVNGTSLGGAATGNDLMVITPNNNASLSNLVLSAGTLSPAFSSGTYNYAVSVPYTTSSITVTPTTSDSHATVTVNGTAAASGSASAPVALTVGTNTVNISCTAQDGVTAITYSVTVTRAAGSSNANLSNLALSAATLSPTFSSSTTSYTANVGNSTSSITVTPTTTDSTATVKVNGLSVVSGSASGSISLNVGSNTITTLVTAGNGVNTMTYTVVVIRAAATPFSFANTGSMNTARTHYAAVLLPSGKVLVAGGNSGATGLATAELYDPTSGAWSYTGSLNTARYGGTANLLPNGLVLIAGGENSGGPLASAELYNPSTGTWTLTGNMNSARYDHTATLLSTGNVLVAGGFGSSILNAAELYNPSTGVWTTINSLNTARYYHSATLLPSGNVLVNGGISSTGTALGSSEIYNPTAGTWTTTTGAMVAARYYHTVTVLPNGYALATGGFNGSTILSSAELFNPSTNTWSSTGSMTYARDFHAASLMPNGYVLAMGGTSNVTEYYNYSTGTWVTAGLMSATISQITATILPSGKVLVAGGGLTQCQVCDPTTTTGSWTTSGNLTYARTAHVIGLLPTGNVMAAGGYNGSSYLNSAEIYNPSTGTWSVTGSMVTARSNGAGVLLPSGSYLAATGLNSTGYLSAAELYNPSTSTWTSTGSLNTAREYVTLTVLANGNILATGGFNGTYIAEAEIYNVSTGVWTTTGSMNYGREYHRATLLPNGNVLVSGGYNGTNLSTCEIYNPSTGMWTLTGSMMAARDGHTANLLPNGMVLVAGGYNTTSSYLTAAELYNPAAGTWTSTGNMVTSQCFQSSNLLSNGKVLLAGGFTGSDLSSAQIYDPTSGVWAATGNLPTAIYSPAPVLMPNGNLVNAGGYNGSTWMTISEVYNVGLGYSASWQPQVTSAPTSVPLGTSLALSGSAFRGISGASSGSTQDSPSNYPVVQLRTLDSGQSAFLLSSPASSWSNTSFTSAGVSGFPVGYALATVFTNGIPGTSSIVNLTATAPSSNAKLSSLALSSGTLSPTFSSSTSSYTAGVPYTTSSITVTPTTADSTATVTVNGVAVTSGVASGAINLSVGANTITTVVTAQAGNTLTYTAVITRASGSSNANLSNLALSSGTLSPTFSSGSTSYTAGVSYNTSSVSITPTTADSTATVTVNGVAVTSGATSGAINLSVGANTITTVVTAQAGNTLTYTVIITRTAASSNANLSNLALSSGTLSPTFSSGATNYTASVSNTTSSTTVTPTTADSTATVTVNGVAVTSGVASGAINLSVGANTITTVVTAQAGNTLTYTVVITRAAFSSIATLSNLALSSGTLSPTFSSSTTSYTASVSNATSSTTVTPITSDSTATVTVNGVAVTSGAASGAINLNVGANAISVVVKAQAGNTLTYFIGVTRAAAGPFFNFVNTGSMNATRTHHVAVLLPNGKVLVAGGYNGSALASAELYDPMVGTWSYTGSLNTARFGCTATLLPNGTVLIAGGLNSSGALSSAEIYNPSTGVWTLTGALNSARDYHTATLLANGNVLVAGGGGSTTADFVGTAEVYNPSTGVWTATNSLNVARNGHTAVLLPNGNVLLAGGINSSGSAEGSSEIYNPTTGTWTLSSGSMVTARFYHSLTILPNGYALAAGGYTTGYSLLGSAELYNPATDTWSSTNSMNVPRYWPATSLMPDGYVLAIGGGTNVSEYYNYSTGTWSLAGPLPSSVPEVTATILPSGKVLVAGGGQTQTEICDPTSGMGAWTATSGTMASARFQHMSTLLPNGNVLAAGGYNGAYLASAEVFNPATGLWTTTGNMANTRQLAGIALLQTGNVLVAGGQNSSTLTSCELYNPTAGTWSATGNLNFPRYYATLTVLANGNILAAGGYNSSSLSSAEIYNPSTGIWTSTGSMITARTWHRATLLPNGQVLVSGGMCTGVGTVSSCELYNPATGTWTATGSMSSVRYNHSSSLLPNGLVLNTGGSNGTGGLVSASELYNPATGTWTATGSMATGRCVHSAVLLPGGKIAVAGGNTSSGATATAELYDPATGAWTTTGSLANSRFQHCVTILPSGKVLVSGGITGSTYLNSSEIFDPGLGYASGWQPQITSAPSTLGLYGSLTLGGTGFTGISGASSGSVQDSSSNYPLVQLRALNSGQSTFLLSSASALWSATSFTSAAVSGFPQGYAVATVFTNGIPSTSAIVNITLSSNASLSNLVLSAGTLSPVFSSGATSYTASVPNATNSITVTPTAAAGTSAITVNGLSVISGNSSGAISLNMGSNTITTVVTAQDGVTTASYTVVVTRGSSSNASLSNLALSKGTLSPIFSSSTTSYAANVSNATPSLTVTPTTADSMATVKVNGVSVTSGTSSGTINLNVGANTLRVVVMAQDGVTSNTNTITVSRNSGFTEWATSIGLTGQNSAPSQSYTGDGISNLEKYAFGVSPMVAGSLGPMQVNGATLISPGGPMVTTGSNGAGGTTPYAVFSRLMNWQSLGLTYEVDFSADLVNWVASNATPTTMANNGAVEAVTVPYPTTVNGQTPLFFRVKVTTP